MLRLILLLLRLILLIMLLPLLLHGLLSLVPRLILLLQRMILLVMLLLLLLIRWVTFTISLAASAAIAAFTPPAPPALAVAFTGIENSGQGTAAVGPVQAPVIKLSHADEATLHVTQTEVTFLGGIGGGP